MALGRAFIEVHADLRPFKTDLGKGVATLIKQTQQAVDKAVREGLATANEKMGGRGSSHSPVIKPKLDTSDIDRGTDRVRQKMKESVETGTRRGLTSVWESPGKTFDQVTLILFGAVAAAAPLIIPMIAGAISAGIATAGIGAGVALAFQDTRIRSAAKEMGSTILDTLTDAADVFVQPVMTALRILTGAGVSFAASMRRGFAALAPFVDDLAGGIARFVDIIGVGLANAFENAGPFVQILAAALPMVADALAYAMEEITASEGARAGLLAFFQLLADAIYFTTDIITFFADRFRDLLLLLNLVPDRLLPEQMRQDIDDMIVAMGTDMPIAATAGSASILRLGGAFGESSAKARDLTASLNEFFGAQLTMMDSNIRFEESIDKVAEAFKGSNDTIDINTEKGRENVRTVNDAIKAAIAARDAKIKETGSVSDANAVYLEQIERLRGVLRNAGLTKKEIDKLIGAYDAIPPEVSTSVTVSGLGAALSQAQALARELSAINSERIRGRQAASGGGPGGFAEGGIVDREQLAWVGEGNRPEAIIPLTNPRRALEVMEEAGLSGLGGGGTIVVQLVLDGRVIEERVVRVTQAQARTVQARPRTML